MSANDATGLADQNVATGPEIALDTTFTATLQKSSARGGWILSSRTGPPNSSLPVTAAIRGRINKAAGDPVTIRLTARLAE